MSPKPSPWAYPQSGTEPEPDARTEPEARADADADPMMDTITRFIATEAADILKRGLDKQAETLTGPDHSQMLQFNRLVRSYPLAETFAVILPWLISIDDEDRGHVMAVITHIAAGNVIATAKTCGIAMNPALIDGLTELFGTVLKGDSK